MKNSEQNADGTSVSPHLPQTHVGGSCFLSQVNCQINKYLMIHFIYIYLIINTFILGLSFDDLPTKYRYSTYLRYIIVTPIVILLYLFFGIFIEILLYLSEIKFSFYVRKTHVQINQKCFVWGSGILNRHGNFIPLSELKVDFRYVVKTYKFISTVKSVHS